MKVYVSASSKEIGRARLWMNKLRRAGIEVTSTWVECITSVGDANPAHATRGQRIAWAQKDLDEIDAADVMWLLMPQTPTSGAWLEYGYAIMRDKMLLVSGPDQTRSIFTALAESYETDDDAFDALVRLKAYDEREDCEHAQGDHPLHRNMLEGAAERDGRVCRLGWPLNT